MLMTVDEFLVASVPDGKVELVRGELRVHRAEVMFGQRRVTLHKLEQSVDDPKLILN